jgi:3-oxoacyl-[acyl-carrier-protein] synthase II
VIIAGGTDSVLSPLSLAGFSKIGASSKRFDNPQSACAPFDKDRDGTIVGEGAAAVVLETLTHAQNRKTRILAEVLGYGLTSDAYHFAMPDPDGHGAARAIKAALLDGNIAENELDWVLAHGTGTLLNDVSETKAIKLALADHARKIPVTSIKGAVGHMLGAAGAISVIVAVKAIQEQLIPQTTNLKEPDPDCDLDYVPHSPRELNVNTVLINAFGFGGQNACLVIKRWQE